MFKCYTSKLVTYTLNIGTLITNHELLTNEI